MSEAKISPVCIREACSQFQQNQQNSIDFSDSEANTTMLSEITKITSYSVEYFIWSIHLSQQLEKIQILISTKHFSDYASVANNTE